MGPWIWFNVCIGVMLAVDLLLHRKAHRIGWREALSWTVVWVVLALLFNVYVYYARGMEAATSYLTGYLIEKSLSVDNLFVFLLIFRYFHTPEKALHKVLFYGVLLAIVLRAAFILIGIELISQFHWIVYLMGLLLLYSGYRLATSHERKIEPEKNPILRLFRRFFSVTNQYEGERFFVRRGGRALATPLFIVLLAVETTDLIFAIDSIPAILAITNDPFIAYTSNIFAVLGMRSLYFVLAHIMALFRYLHYGLALILIFTGLKMLTADLYPISNLLALAVVALILTVSIVSSILKARD
jgi:tellurite resistance protein TerC